MVIENFCRMKFSNLSNLSFFVTVFHLSLGWRVLGCVPPLWLKDCWDWLQSPIKQKKMDEPGRQQVKRMTMEDR